MMMMGWTMSYDLDAAKGRAIGSVIKMRGRMLGLELLVEEVITERSPPLHQGLGDEGCADTHCHGRLSHGLRHCGASGRVAPTLIHRVQ